MRELISLFNTECSLSTDVFEENFTESLKLS